MATASDHEQYQLELINRARLDPQGEAQRLGLGLNDGLSPGRISTDPKQPLAFEESLIDAARGHSLWMLDQDIFSHTGQGGSSPGDRMRAAGYEFTGSWTWGENIAYQGTTGGLPVTDFVERTYENLFESPGHRTNLLGDVFQEVGLGIRTGTFDGFNAVMVTQNFARSGQKVFVTGVAYDDGDGDDFYSPGEGRSGLSVTVEGSGQAPVSSDTSEAGGYQQQVQAGTREVTFSGGGLAAPLSLLVEVEDENIKLDLIDGAVVASSSDAVMGDNLQGLLLLGAADLEATGNALDNSITGNRGDNILDGALGDDILNGGEGDDQLIGGAGEDTALYLGNQADYQVHSNGEETMVRALSGAEGVDRLRGIELIQFADQVVELPPSDADLEPEPGPVEPPIAEEPEPDPDEPPVAEDPIPDPDEPPVAEDPIPDPDEPPVAEDPIPDPDEPPVAEDPIPDPDEPPVAEDPIPDPDEPPVAEDPIPDPDEPPVAEDPIPDPDEPPVAEDPIPDPDEPPVAEDPIPDPDEPPVAEDPIPDPDEPPVAEDPIPDPDEPPVADDPIADPDEPPVAENPDPDPVKIPVPICCCPRLVADSPSPWGFWRLGGGRLSLDDFFDDGGRWWRGRSRGRPEPEETEPDDQETGETGRLTLADFFGGGLDGMSRGDGRLGGRRFGQAERVDDQSQEGERGWAGAFDVRAQTGLDAGPMIEVTVTIDYV